MTTKSVVEQIIEIPYKPPPEKVYRLDHLFQNISEWVVLTEHLLRRGF